MKKKKEDFVHLHVHSDFSQLDGCGKVSKYVEEAARRGSPAIAFTEHGSMRGYYQEHKECEEHDVKPIYGIEFYVANDMKRKGLTDVERDFLTQGLKRSEHKAAVKKYEEKEGIRDRWHLTAWARNNKGLKNLFRLSTLAYTDGFYYKPRIDVETLMRYSKGVSIATGCASSVMHDRFFNGQKKKAFEIAEQLREKFGENMWLEVQPHDLDIQVSANEFNLELKRRWGKKAKLLATQDAHYVKRGDSEHHDVMLCIGTGNTLSNPNRFSFGSDQFWMKTRKEMREAFIVNHPHMSKEQVKEALDSTVLFSEQVKAKVKIDYHAALLPHVEVPKPFENEWHYLKQLCVRGWSWRDMTSRITAVAKKEGRTFSDMQAVYKKRLLMELSALKKQNFISYFLIVHDLYDWVREQKIMCGPGRGSVAGSLVSFLLGFTCVDPVEHGLIFERFINPERIDLPDIDMDFEDDRRLEIMGYLREKYGHKNVAQIATVGRLSGKQCVKDVSRVLDVPYLEAQEVTGSIVETDKAEDEGMLETAFSEIKVCRDFDKKYPDVLRHAVVLEGMAKTLGIHAAGCVVAPDRLVKYLPLEVRKYKGQDVVVTALDMRGVAAMGLVKLDVLGLRVLTVLRECVEAIKESKGVDVELEKIDMNDKEVLQLFTEQDFSGVFQYDTPSMQKVSDGVVYDSFSDIVALNALNRPGTTRSGLADQFVQRKKNPKLVKKDLFHPKVTEITSDTLGIIVYQEHVIKIFTDVAGYSLAKADKLRSAIGKSKGDKVIEKERRKFTKGAIKYSGLLEEEATKVFNAIIRFGSYGFNKSHATAYGLNAYWCQWMKHYYPLEFYWAMMKNEPQLVKIQSLARDAKARGIKILPPDVSASSKNFTIDKKEGAIRGSLLDIKNVGESAAQEIEKNRPFKNFIDFLSRVNRRKCHKGVVLALAKSGALDSLLPNSKWFIENMEEFWRKLNKEGLESKSIRVDLIKSFDEDDYEKEDKQLVALSVNPVAFGEHPLDAYKKFIEKNITVKIASTSEENFYKKNDGKTVFIFGSIQKKKIGRVGDFHTGELPDETKRKKMFWGSQFANVHLEDAKGVQNRVKFDYDVFDNLYHVIDSGDSTPILACVNVDDEYKALRVNFAVNIEEIRVKLKRGDELDFWERVVCGGHPALSYPWKSKKLKRKFLSDVEAKKSKVEFCGVVTHAKLRYDKRGNQMCFFGLLGVKKHVEVFCFSAAWARVRKVVKPQSLMILELKRARKVGKPASYFFDGGEVRVLKKSPS